METRVVARDALIGTSAGSSGVTTHIPHDAKDANGYTK